ncbi:hypothetical protein F53441_943 [Fusarium austroafricanum]|uniref:Uncharacterized protein n=1 Tax=Fusarium austroafricanum TaxID=2364996 RepID=A0A8H4KWI0_9HYPO|nr:hypothetical protein F53441_943 [Fusarium austroafricanum]
MADHTTEEMIETEPLWSLEEPLGDFLIGGEDSTTRTENASISDWERHNVIERTRGQIHTRVELLEVTHGTYDDDGEEATLMIFRFRFDPQKNSRRVIRARVEVTFQGKDGNPAPIVEAIAPEERWSVVPTTDSETFTTGGELNLGASGVPFVTAGGSAKLEKTITRDISDATTVTGGRRLSKKNSGPYDVAVWNILENDRRKTGVPDSVTVAILLRREDSEPFDATVELEADVDWMTGLERKFLRLPLDDPILFNPQSIPKKKRKGRNHGAENLSSVDLYELCHVRFAVEAPFVAK